MSFPESRSDPNVRNEYTFRRPRRAFCPNDRRTLMGHPLDTYINMDGIYSSEHVSEGLEDGLKWVESSSSTNPSVSRALAAIRAIRHKDAGIFEGAKDLVRKLANQEHLTPRSVYRYLVDALTTCEVTYGGDYQHAVDRFDNISYAVKTRGHPELLQLCIEERLSVDEFLIGVSAAHEALEAFTVNGDVMWELVQSVTNEAGMKLAEALHKLGNGVLDSNSEANHRISRRDAGTCDEAARP